ncbi:hypothetical protein P0Y35_15870 [Kiritimatiellaeota bacterium B1221]|nr:hypothetical protein [Kiritimatiellaeota bacterium B1221]
MKEQSQRMLAAGWVLQSIAPETWQATSPENQKFIWKNHSWHPEEDLLLAELKKNEQAIQEGLYSKFIGTSRLSSTGNDAQASLLTQWLVRHASIKGNTLLRARVAPDPRGDELLYQAGARRVETLLQPWPEAPASARFLPSHLLICEHVADTLPKAERNHTLKRLTTHLHPDAEAYFSFYQMDALPLHRPHESSGDGYIFQQGPHQLFLKPTLPGQCAPAVQKALGGFAEEVDLLYDQIICRWFPHD